MNPDINHIHKKPILCMFMPLAFVQTRFSLIIRVQFMVRFKSVVRGEIFLNEKPIKCSFWGRIVFINYIQHTRHHWHYIYKSLLFYLLCVCSSLINDPFLVYFTQWFRNISTPYVLFPLLQIKPQCMMCKHKLQ